MSGPAPGLQPLPLLRSLSLPEPPPTPRVKVGCQDRFVACKKRRQAHLQKFFRTLANTLYNYPWYFILGSVALTGVLSAGFWPGVPKWIDGAERLYSLQNSLSRTHGELHRLLFDESRTRNSNIIVTLEDPDSDNLLRWQHVTALFYIDELVRGTALEPFSARRVAYTPAPPTVLTTGSVDDASLKPSSLVYADLCHVRGDHECEGAQLIDFLRDGFDVRARRSGGGSGGLAGGLLGKRGADDLPALVAIDDFAINFHTLKMHPLGLMLGGVDKRQCERPVPPAVLGELKERDFPPGLIDKKAIKIDEAAGTLLGDCIVRARAALLTYSLRDSLDAEANAAWEASLVSVLRPLRLHWKGLRVDIAASRTRDDELKASTSESGDLAYVVLTFLVLLGYTTSINMSTDLYAAKPYSGMAGAFAAVLGLISGMGLASLCGLSLVPTAFVCPFLILGIGVDDMFVIINSYALAFDLRGKERCAMALSTSGTAISLTTVTSLTSFAIGSLSPYLAIRNFCIFCSAGLLFGYFYVFTIFFPVLCLESRREVERNLCCLSLPPAAESDEEEEMERAAKAAPADEHHLFTRITAMVDAYMDAGVKGCRQTAARRPESRRSFCTIEPKGNVGRGSRIGILKFYGPLLMNQNFKCLVILAFAILIVISVYGILHLERGLDLTDLAPPDSYLRQFDSSMTQWINTFDLPTDIFFVNGETQWWSLGFRQQMRRLTEALLSEGVAVKVIDPLAIISGDPHYRPWLLSGERKTFESALYNAVANPRGTYYEQHRQSFLWQGTNLRAWKMVILPPFMTSSQQRASWMVAVRKICRRHSVYLPQGDTDAANALRTPTAAMIRGSHHGAVATWWVPSPAFSWNYMMHYHESDLRVIFFVALEMSTAGSTLAAVTFLALPDVLSGAIVTSVMCMIDITIVGFMYYWHIKLNMISMVNLLISIGFAIDYSTHVAHTFLECRGVTREKRSVEALVLMGNPVLHGAAASVLGVGMLGFSKSHIFKIFFKMMTLIVIFGVAYGAVFMPVILSFIGTFAEEHHEEQHIQIEPAPPSSVHTEERPKKRLSGTGGRRRASSGTRALSVSRELDCEYQPPFFASPEPPLPLTRGLAPLVSNFRGTDSRILASRSPYMKEVSLSRLCPGPSTGSSTGPLAGPSRSAGHLLASSGPLTGPSPPNREFSPRPFPAGPMLANTLPNPRPPPTPPPSLSQTFAPDPRPKPLRGSTLAEPVAQAQPPRPRLPQETVSALQPPKPLASPMSQTLPIMKTCDRLIRRRESEDLGSKSTRPTEQSPAQMLRRSLADENTTPKPKCPLPITSSPAALPERGHSAPRSSNVSEKLVEEEDEASSVTTQENPPEIELLTARGRNLDFGHISDSSEFTD